MGNGKLRRETAEGFPLFQAARPEPKASAAPPSSAGLQQDRGEREVLGVGHLQVPQFAHD
jgi:hypothetical protein